MILKNWLAQMSATSKGVERQQIKTPIHLMYPRKVPQQRPNLEVVVMNKEGHPLETQMMVETRTLLRKQLKNLILFILPQKEKEKFKRRDKNYLKLKEVPKPWKLMM
jgi:hypothetical protein